MFHLKAMKTSSITRKGQGKLTQNNKNGDTNPYIKWNKKTAF